MYSSIFDLVRDFLKDEAVNHQDRTLRRYLKPDLLLIDDMGLKALPKHSGEYLLEVIMRRYENRSTIMTSNRPLEECSLRPCPHGLERFESLELDLHTQSFSACLAFEDTIRCFLHPNLSLA